MLLPTAALDSPSIVASHPVRRVAHAHLAEAVAPVYEAPLSPAAAAPVSAAAPVPDNMDALRDQYADDRLHHAVEQYRRQGPACGCEGVEWGSIDCLLPTQAYRVALPNPPVEMLDAMVPPALRRLAVPRLEHLDLDDGFESSRQRRQAANWP